MVTYNRYVNQEDHVWYDSSNIVYSKCYDTQDSMYKNLKIVFKGGRTYLYKDVNANEYVQLKMAQSTGQAFNKLIKKYNGVRLSDTDMEKLNELQEQFKDELKEKDEQKVGDVVYQIKCDEKTGEFIIIQNDKVLFRGIEGKVSVINLFNSLSMKYTLEQVDELPNDSDEHLDEIVINVVKD